MNIPYFRQHTLANLEASRRRLLHADLPNKALFHLVLELASHGHPDTTVALDRLKNQPDGFRHYTSLRMAEQAHLQVRKFFRFEEIDDQALDAFYQQHGHLYLRHKVRPNYLIVMFTTMYNNLFYSNAIMASLLSRVGCSLLILRDATYLQYLAGAKGTADTYFDLLAKIREIADENGVEKLFLTAASTGTFPALLASLRMPCDGYLGFSQMIDSRPEAHPDYADAARLVDPRLLLNLTSLVAEADPAVPRAIYYGQSHAEDSAYAAQVAGLPAIKAIGLPRTGHNTVQPLMAHGRLHDAFSVLLSGSGDWPTPRVVARGGGPGSEDAG
jgi:hypothetical protein